MSVWRLALASLQQHIPAMLLYVVESKGSSPGRQGFFMVVNASGAMEGSIGGGIMEHKFTEMARETLRQGTSIRSLRRQVHDKEVVKDQSGMICSGEQTLLLFSLHAADLETLEQLLTSLGQYRNGALKLSPAGLSFSPAPPQRDHYFEQLSEEEWVYEERTGYRDHLFIVGGGHCALALSKVMRMMDFYISLFDDREDLDSVIRNEYAHERAFLKDYDELQQRVAGDVRYHYIVVMTQGYRTDDRAVRALLAKDFRYFGLLGSKTKIEKMLTAYRRDGMPEERLNKLHAPAGMAIHSQTPEEIAISIAAEIIGVRNG